jgi:hypothetical protein
LSAVLGALYQALIHTMLLLAKLRSVGACGHSIVSLQSPACMQALLLTCVPLMMTVCAGRLTPHARVAVHTSTCSNMRQRTYAYRQYEKCAIH